MEDRRLQCVYCNGQANAVRGPFLSCTTGFTISNRPPQASNVAADTQCSMCFDDFQAGEALFRHDACQHTWHQNCIDAWVDMSAQNARGPTDVTCGMCRAPIMHIDLPPEHTEIVSWVPHQLAEDFADWVAFAGKVVVELRDDLTRVIQDQALAHPDFMQFLRQQIGVDTANGPYPEYSLNLGPRSRPGSEIFNRVESVQGGAVSVPWCPHLKEYFFMEPQTFYNNICALFASDWSPYDGGSSYFQPQLPQRPRRLRDLLLGTQHFMLQNLGYYSRWNNGDRAVELFHVQLQSFFPHSVALNGSARLYLRLVRPSGLPDRIPDGDIAMGDGIDDGQQGHDDAQVLADNTQGLADDAQAMANNGGVVQTEWHDDWQVRAIAWSQGHDGARIFTNDETRALVDSLGGVGDGFTLILGQYEIQESFWLDRYVEHFRRVAGKFGDPVFPGFQNELLPLVPHN